jgi:hypothetical protein
MCVIAFIILPGLSLGVSPVFSAFFAPFFGLPAWLRQPAITGFFFYLTVTSKAFIAANSSAAISFHLPGGPRWLNRIKVSIVSFLQQGHRFGL